MPAFREASVANCSDGLAHRFFEPFAEKLFAVGQLPKLARMRMKLELIPQALFRKRATDLAQLARRVKLEQCYFGTHPGLDQYLEGLFQHEEHRTRPRMLGEEIDHRLLLKARINHSPLWKQGADTLGDGQHRGLGRPGRVLMDTN